MSVNGWLFYPSLVVLVYVVGVLLVARFWPRGALGAVQLGDMAPARPVVIRPAIRGLTFQIVDDDAAQTLSGIERSQYWRLGRNLAYPEDGC